MAGFSPEVLDLLRKLGAGGIPIGAGKVFWVNTVGEGGDDGNVGTRPDQPFLTITHALTQCDSERNDYIMVIDDYQEPAAVAINKTRVHIIGLGNYFRPNSNHAFVALNALANHAIFIVSSNSNNCEIAGFALGGGAAHAGIENSAGTPMGLHIHDCVFGHFFSHNTPQDGIRVGANATNIRIEHCVFLGTSVNAQGLLTRDGIRFAAAANSYGGAIVDNILQGLPIVAINISGHGEALVIKENVFTVPDSANGEAITLGATSLGCLVLDNKAAHGMGEAAGNAFNPYRDLSGVNTNNGWAWNSYNNAYVEPVGV